MARRDRKAVSLSVRLDDDRIRIGERLSITFQRTLRIPDDDQSYPLPPGLGPFPIRRAADFASKLPDDWRDDFLIPMYQREALWIALEGADWKPNAVKIGIGRIDALTGETWSETLSAEPQNYLVAPDQPWIDGINAGDGFIRQFVAMPLGGGHTVEGQISGEEREGGVQIIVFEPKPGRFPDQEPPPQLRTSAGMSFGEPMAAAMPEAMGIAAGGRMRQKIYPDQYGLHTWDPDQRASFNVRIVNTRDWLELTGEPAPPTPVDAASYNDAGLPWFDLYDEAEGDIAASEKLSRVKSVGGAKETSVTVRRVKKLRKK
jgi:hypothetical protein